MQILDLLERPLTFDRHIAVSEEKMRSVAVSPLLLGRLKEDLFELEVIWTKARVWVYRCWRLWWCLVFRR